MFTDVKLIFGFYKILFSGLVAFTKRSFYEAFSLAFLTELDRASHSVIRDLISMNEMARGDMEEQEIASNFRNKKYASYMPESRMLGQKKSGRLVSGE